MTIDRSRKELIHSLFDTSGRGLEIGAGFSPLVPKEEGYWVETVDHASAEELRLKYTGASGVDVSRIEEVDYVWDGRPLAELIGARNRYDFIVASHVIEHIPDMLGFLKECEVLLKPTGTLVLAVPDKRRCFDVLRPLSTTGAVLQAHFEKRKRHSPAMAFDEIAYATKLDGSPHWAQGAKGHISLVNALESAQANFNRAVASEEYFDYHAWVFTPGSFRLILRELNELGAIALREAVIRPTSNHEFFVTASQSAKGCPFDRLTLVQRVIDETRECPVKPGAVI